MKRCKFCNKPLPKPDNPKTRNYTYCNIECRKAYYKPLHSEWQRKWKDKKHTQESEDRMQCLVCGRWYRQVGSHIFQRHGMTAREYREEYELEVKRGLTRGSYRELKAEQVFENGTVENLEQGAKYRFKPGDKVPEYKRSPETLEKLRRAREIAFQNKRNREGRGE